MTVTRVFAAGCADAWAAIATTATAASTSIVAARRATPESGSRWPVFVVGWLGCIDRLGRRRLGIELGLPALFDVLLDLLLELLLRDDLGDGGLRLLVLGGRGCNSLRLGGLERSQLLLRRQVATLGHDERLHLRDDVLEELDRDRVTPDALERVDRDLAAVDADLPRAPDLVGDVRRSHRPEQRPGRAGLHLEAQNGLAEEVGDLLRLLGRARLVLGPLRVDTLDLGHAGGSRVLR